MAASAKRTKRSKTVAKAARSAAALPQIVTEYLEANQVERARDVFDRDVDRLPREVIDPVARRLAEGSRRRGIVSADRDVAIAELGHAIRYLRMVPESEALARALDERGVMLLGVQRFLECERDHRDALAICERVGARRGPTLTHLSTVLHELDRDEAERLADEAVVEARRFNDRKCELDALYALARAMAQQFRFDEVTRIAGEAMANADNWMRSFFRVLLAMAAHRRGELAVARDEFAAAHQTFVGAPRCERLRSQLARDLATVALDAGDLYDARGWIAKSIDEVPRVDKPLTRLVACQIDVELPRRQIAGPRLSDDSRATRADVRQSRRRDKMDRLAAVRDELVRLLRTPASSPERQRATVRLELGHVAELAGDRDEARAHYTESALDYEASKHPDVIRALAAAAGLEADRGDGAAASALIAQADGVLVALPFRGLLGDAIDVARGRRDVALARADVANVGARESAGTYLRAAEMLAPRSLDIRRAARRLEIEISRLPPRPRGKTRS